MNCILGSQLGLLVPKGWLTSGISSTDSVVLQVYVRWKDVLAAEGSIIGAILADISTCTRAALLRK